MWIPAVIHDIKKLGIAVFAILCTFILKHIFRIEIFEKLEKLEIQYLN